MITNLTAFPTDKIFKIKKKYYYLTILNKQKNLLKPQSPTKFQKIPQISFFTTKYNINTLNL